MIKRESTITEDVDGNKLDYLDLSHVSELVAMVAEHITNKHCVFMEFIVVGGKQVYLASTIKLIPSTPDEGAKLVFTLRLKKDDEYDD